MGAILSFLGSAAFRGVWGEVSAWFTKKQADAAEIKKLEAQANLADRTSANKIEEMKTAAELHDRGIQIQATVDQDKDASDLLKTGIEKSTLLTGVTFVDGWNGVIRPAAATVALVMWILALHQQGWVMAAFDLDLVGSIFGFYFADRSLRHRGK